MKWLIPLLLIPFLLFGQQKTISISNIQPEFYTVTLDSTDTTTIYYIFPPPNGINSRDRTAISTTAPTSASAQAKNLDFASNGVMTIAIIPTYVTAEESDSLAGFIQTLIYDENLAAWKVSTNDTLFLDFSTAGTYTGTSVSYLDWTSNSCYTADVGGSIMPGAGFALTLLERCADEAGSDAKIYVSFWYQK